MSLRHWAWIAIGLLAWALLVVAWATSPDICWQAAAQTSHHCKGR